MRTDVMPRAMLAAMLADFVADEATTPKVRLFVDDIDPDDAVVLGDLTEPTGSWYAEAAGTYGQVYENDDGSMTVTVGSVQFNYSGTDPAEVVRGYFVVRPVADPGPDVLLHVGKLDTAVTMSGTLDSVIVQPQITLPPVR